MAQGEEFQNQLVAFAKYGSGCGCGFSKLGPYRSTGDFEGRAVAPMATPTAEAVSVSLGEPRSRTELVLEMIALRHQIAVLKRSGSRRPCLGIWDRLFWILLSWWWPAGPKA